MIDLKKLEDRKKEVEQKLKTKDLDSEEKKKLEKELKKLEEDLRPKYYNVVMEVNIPAIAKYKVLARSPEEALEKAKHMAPTEHPTLKIGMLKRISAKVMKYGTLLIELTKTL